MVCRLSSLAEYRARMRGARRDFLAGQAAAGPPARPTTVSETARALAIRHAGR
jgi:hypothetical protein